MKNVYIYKQFKITKKVLSIRYYVKEMRRKITFTILKKLLLVIITSYINLLFIRHINDIKIIYLYTKTNELTRGGKKSSNSTNNPYKEFKTKETKMKILCAMSRIKVKCKRLFGSIF